VVDAAVGLTPADQETAELLRRAQAPVLVAVNKADNERREQEGAEFYALGWDDTYAISAAHGRGTADLLDAIVWALPPESAEELARKDRERQADEWARDVAAGRLESYPTGEEPDAPGSEETLDEEVGEELVTGVAAARRWDAAIAAEAD